MKKQTYFRPLFTLIIILLAIRCAYPQVSIEFVQKTANAFKLDEIWNFTALNTMGENRNIELIVTVLNSDEELLCEAKVGHLVLLPGTTAFNSFSFRDIDYNYYNKEFKDLIGIFGEFPSGIYIICFEVLSVGDENQLFKGCYQVNSSTISTDIINKRNNKQFYVGGYAEAGVYYTYSNSNDLFFPGNNSWINIQPEISVFGLPLGAQMLVATDNSIDRQNINSFSIHLDINRLKEGIRTRLALETDKITQTSKWNSLLKRANINELLSIDNVLNNPELQKELDKLRVIDDIKRMLADSNQITFDLVMDSLKQAYDENEQLEQRMSDRERDLKRENDFILDSVRRADTNDVQSGEKLAAFEKQLSRKSEILTDSIKQLSHEKEKLIQKIGDYEKLLNNKRDLLVDSLKRKFNENEQVEKKRAAYEKILNRKHQLDSLNKVYNDLDTLAQKTEAKVRDLLDIRNLQKIVRNHAGVSKLEKRLLNIKSLKLGNCYPDYSELSIMHQRINGISLELIPAGLYLSALYGTVKRETASVNLYDAGYRRNVFSVGLGYGSDETSNFRIRYLGFDDESSSLASDDPYRLVHGPQSNKVLNLTTSLSVFRNRIKIISEVSGSQTNRNTDIVDLQEVYVDSIAYSDFGSQSNWLKNILKQQDVDLYTAVDYAFRGEISSSFFENNSNMHVGIKRIGQNFRSFGLPFLITNLMTYEGGLKQYLLKKRVTLKIAGNYNHNNIDHSNSITSCFTRLSFESNFRFPKWPAITISYKPVFLKSDTLRFRSYTLSLNVLYGFKKHKIRHAFSVNTFYQSSTGNVPGFENMALLGVFNYSVFLRPTHAINMAISDFVVFISDSSLNTTTFNVSTTFNLAKNLCNTIGLSYIVNKNEQKLGINYDLSWSFAKRFSLRLSLGNNVYDNYFNIPISDYNQFNARTVLTTRL